jgi:hypothetical protein
MLPVSLLAKNFGVSYTREDFRSCIAWLDLLVMFSSELLKRFADVEPDLFLLTVPDQDV